MSWSKVFDEPPAPGVAAFFLDLLDAAKTAQCSVACFFPPHPRCEVLLDLLLEMKRQLVGELLVEILFPEKRAQPLEEFHSDLPLHLMRTSLSEPLTAAFEAVVSQFAVEAALRRHLAR